MSANQLPENMGKKIVEALKRQAMYEDDYSSQNDSSNVQQDFHIEEKSQYQNTASDFQINEITEEPKQFNIPAQMELNEPSMQFSMPVQNVQPSYSPELPTNVAVLKKLISQLPAGVSKQVGAQIIRQTIEALGISMNSVLQEAQQVQESLNSAVTECTIKMQEYKNQIMQLEANTRDFQRQMSQINDLISLFILTDNKK